MGSDRALRMGPLEWALLVALSVLWGGSFFFAKLAVAALPPFTIVLGRVGLAAVALNLLVRALGQRIPGDRRNWAAFFVMGVLNNLVPFSLIIWAQTQIASGLAAILNGATPLFTALLAHWLTADERLTWNRLLGVALGLAGVTIMIGMEVLSGLGLHVLAECAVLAATVSYAFAGIFGRRFRGQPPLVTATGQVTATTVMMLPIALIADRPWTLAMPTPVALGAIAGLALLSTALAYVLFFRILAAAGATNLLLVTLLIPVSALLLGHFILQEGLALQQLLGMTLIALGLAAIDGRLFSAARRPLTQSHR
ncbi:MAG TPA: DMT family transporter [Candidatus Acidoferrum sp.]|nr:DMT family transporter [Candidatus Acidoferrum sp.]